MECEAQRALLRKRDLQSASIILLDGPRVVYSRLIRAELVVIVDQLISVEPLIGELVIHLHHLERLVGQ